MDRKGRGGREKKTIHILMTQYRPKLVFEFKNKSMPQEKQ